MKANAKNGEVEEPASRVETLHAQHGTPNTPPAPSEKTRVDRGTGTSISIELKESPELLEKIRKHAKEDDREPSKWLRRRLMQLDEEGNLFFKL